jgi:hypothetical protein
MSDSKIFSLCQTRELDYLSKLQQKTLLVVFVPGNPGATEFYHWFLENVQNQLFDSAKYSDFHEVSTYALCHANHHLHKNDASNFSWCSFNYESYGLPFQIQYQLDFIDLSCYRQ